MSDSNGSSARPRPHARSAAPRRGTVRAHTAAGHGWATGLAGLGLMVAATALAWVAALPDSAAQAPGGAPPSAGTMSVDDIRPGMKGYAVTVFSGSGTDRFDIEVIDVVPDYQTGQDAILFRSPDPRLVHSGIVGGMSGSPIYIDGKLVGALTYGYRFNKDPIGGITPIANMLAVDKLPARPEVLPGARKAPTARASGREGTMAWADAMLGLDTAPTPARRRPDEAMGLGGLEPLGAPMTLAGYGPRASQFLGDSLGLTVARGGGSGAHPRSSTKPATTAKRWVPGDSVSVVLVAGDLSAAPNGTVTWVGGKQGERLLAFGHPMRGGGPTNLPIADARVHVIIPSVERSVKIASPLEIRGAMIQDRQPAIALRTDLQAPMFPVTTMVTGAEQGFTPRTYHSTVASDPTMSAPLAISLMLQALDEAASDAVELEVTLDMDITLETSRGVRTVSIKDEVWFPFGVAPGPIVRSRGPLLLQAIFDNPFEIARVLEIKQRAKVQYGVTAERIEGIEVRTAEVRAGDLLAVDVLLKPPVGPRRRQLIEVRIPSDLEDEDILLEIAGGAYAMPYRKPADTVDDMIDAISQGYAARAIVASVYDAREGLATERGLVGQVPESVLESLGVDGSTRQNLRIKRVARRVIETPRLVDGSQTIKIHVLAPRPTNKSRSTGDR